MVRHPTGNVHTLEVKEPATEKRAAYRLRGVISVLETRVPIVLRKVIGHHPLSHERSYRIADAEPRRERVHAYILTLPQCEHCNRNRSERDDLGVVVRTQRTPREGDHDEYCSGEGDGRQILHALIVRQTVPGTQSRQYQPRRAGWYTAGCLPHLSHGAVCPRLRRRMSSIHVTGPHPRFAPRQA